MTYRLQLFSALVGVGLFAAQHLAAVTIDPNLPGSTQFDLWDNLSNLNYPNNGSYPGNSAWSNPPQSGSGGDAVLDRVAGSGGPGSAGPFPSSSSIYFGGGTTSTLGGTLVVRDTTPVLNVRSLVFQLEIGEAEGEDFYLSAFPELTINGITSLGGPAQSSIVDSYQNGTFPNPDTGQDEPVFVNTWYFVYDLSGAYALDPLLEVDSIELEWSQVGHSQLYSIRLDQTDVAIVPEPSSMFLGALVLAGFGLVRRRR